jgi:hypothetical protein
MIYAIFTPVLGGNATLLASFGKLAAPCLASAAKTSGQTFVPTVEMLPTRRGCDRLSLLLGFYAAECFVSDERAYRIPPRSVLDGSGQDCCPWDGGHDLVRRFGVRHDACIAFQFFEKRAILNSHALRSVLLYRHCKTRSANVRLIQ